MYAERYSPDLQLQAAFAPGPDLDDRPAWESLRRDIRQSLIAAGERELGAGWPAISATDYMRFSRDGNRTAFEEVYFARRRRLNALILAEGAEGQGRFADQIANGVMHLCEESGWQLPAHNSHQRGGARDPLPDPDRPVIDLFAAETGAQLAVIAATAGPLLDRVSPMLVRRIDAELERRIFRPYLERHFWWMGNGDEPMNNWTAWCTQNVLLAAFSRPLPRETRHAILARTTTSLDAFIKDYGDDGACEEGPLYYRHAALCLWGAHHILATVAPAAFSPLWAEPKLRNMAEYLPFMHVAANRYINFADSSSVLGRATAREYLFGRAVGSDVLVRDALASAGAEAGQDLPDEINLWYRLLELFTGPAMRAQPQAKPQLPDRFFPSVGLLVARDGVWTLAAKAGHNGEGHNHNDVGSVTLYKSGRPVLIDMGVESYTAKTFSPRRYEIWTMQSAWHNLPSFDGVMQQDGRQYAARDVETDMGETSATIGFDIAPAYPPQAGVTRYHRTATLERGKGVRIADDWKSRHRPTLSLILAQSPQIEENAIVLDGLARIDIEHAASLSCEAVEITDARLRTAWPERIWRISITPAGDTLILSII